MKTEAVVAQTWDNLVFENRNKAYGAYSVRRSYSDRVIYALFISMAGLVLILTTPMLVSLLKGEEVKLPPVISDLPPTLIDLKKKVDIILTQHTPPPAHAPATASQRKIPPVVTTADVPDENIPLVEQLTSGVEGSGQISESDPNAFTTGISEGVGELPVVKRSEPFITVEEMPEYVGGTEAMVRFIQRKIHYPAAARRTGVDGTVYVSFVIDPEGKIINPSILRGISADCDAEALRLISMMPLWKAGRQNHTPVSVKMVLPIRFKIV
jgi:periplasmic protein TonB